jgi:hypothetical protein
MLIGRKAFTLSLILAASLLLPSVTFAQSASAPSHEWSALSAVATGSKLVVNLKNGKSVKGKLSSVSDTALSLSADNKPVSLNRDDVLRVYQTSKKSATKATLIGAGVGAGVGAAIGAASTSNDDFFISRGQAAAGFAVLGAGAGALIGFAIGKSGGKRVLIYEAQ